MKKSGIILVLALSLLLCGCANSELKETTLPETMQTDPAPTIQPQTTLPTTISAIEPVTQSTDSTETIPPEFTDIDNYLEYREYYELLKPDTPSEDNWYYRAMSHYFDMPQEVDIYYFFYKGMCQRHGWDSMDAAEATYLENSGLLTFTDVQIMPVQSMEQVLLSTLGVTLNELSKGIPDGWIYYDQTDSYYSSHGDTVGPGMIYIYEVDRTETALRIHYGSRLPVDINEPSQGIADDYIHRSVITMTITPDGSYIVQSNQKSG